MRELSVKTNTKIVLLILDGLGGLPMDPSGQTELEAPFPGEIGLGAVGAGQFVKLDEEVEGAR